MAYEILYGTSVIYRAGEREVASAVLKQYANKPSKLTVSLPPNHSLARSMTLHNFASHVFVNWDGEQEFAGYISDSSTDIHGMVTITVDDVLSLLDMPLVKLADVDFKKSACEPSELLEAIRTAYNLYGTRRFDSIAVTSTTYGTIGYLSDGTRIVDCDPNEVMSPWAMLKKWVIDPYKAVVKAKVNSSGYYEVSVAGGAFGQHTTPIERGVNMTKITASRTSEGMLTGMYVTGAKFLSIKNWVAAATLSAPKNLALGSTEIQVTGGSASVDYTVKDGDKLRIGNNVYQAYLPSSKTLRVTGNTTQYTLPIRPPLNYKYTTGLSYHEVQVAAQSATFAELRGNIALRDGTSVSVSGIQCYVIKNTLSVSSNRIGRGPKFEHYTSDAWFAPDQLIAAAAGELSKRLNFSETYDVDAVSPALYQTDGELYRVGNRVPVVADELDVDKTMLISAATTDILDLGATRFEIGYERKTATGRVSDLRLDVAHVSHRVTEGV